MQILKAGSFKELLNFPAEMTFRVIVKKEAEIEKIIALMEDICGEAVRSAPQKRISRNGTYISWSLTFRVKDDQVLNDLYRKTASHPMVMHVI